MAEEDKKTESGALAKSNDASAPDPVKELVAQHPELGPILATMPDEARTMLVSTFMMEIKHKPRLPVIHAEDIAEYNRVLSNSGTDIFRATLDAITVTHEQKRAAIALNQQRFDAELRLEEKEQLHQHALDNREQDRKDLGLKLGFVFGVLLIAGCVALAWLQQNPAPVVTLAGIGIVLAGGGALVAWRKNAVQAPDPPKQLPPPKS